MYKNLAQESEEKISKSVRLSTMKDESKRLSIKNAGKKFKKFRNIIKPKNSNSILNLNNKKKRQSVPAF